MHRKFDISRVESDDVVIIIGKKATGKSHLAKELLRQNLTVPLVLVISPTETKDGNYGNIVPPECIQYKYDSDTIGNFYKKQLSAVRRDVDEKMFLGLSTVDPRAIIVMDDCMYDNNWTEDRNLHALFLNGKHHRTTCVVTMQYPTRMPPSMRTNVAFVFIFRDDVISNRKRIYENYGDTFESFEMFCRVMDSCKEGGYECIVIDNKNNNSKQVEDEVFWYEADADAGGGGGGDVRR